MLGELDPCGGGDPIPLLKGKLLVGRKSFCDIQIDFPNISSRHCELELKDGYWIIRDLGSTNGIRVNGTGCDSAALVPGDEVWIGRHRFTIHYKLAADARPPEREVAHQQPQSGLFDKAGIRFANEKLSNKPKDAARQEIRREITLGELVPCGGGDVISLFKQRLTIGRHRECDITLRYFTVSTRHCEMEFAEGFWLVRDLGSSNGTRVDGIRIDAKWLPPGSILWISNYRFEVRYTPLRQGSPPSHIPVSLDRSLMDKAGLQRRK